MSGDSSYSDFNHSPNFVNLDLDLNSVTPTGQRFGAKGNF